jgi:hypothetical protein
MAQMEMAVDPPRMASYHLVVADIAGYIAVADFDIAFLIFARPPYYILPSLRIY